MGLPLHRHRLSHPPVLFFPFGDGPFIGDEATLIHKAITANEHARP